MGKIYILTLVICLLSIYCKKEHTKPIPDNSDYIEYGTSFNNCIGYCKHNMKLTSEKIICTKSSWKTLEPVTTSQENNTENWKNLLSKINLETFISLNSVYGCPDCADGGAEWIEIKIGNKIHLVTFEFYNEPESLKPILLELRAIQCN